VGQREKRARVREDDFDKLGPRGSEREGGEGALVGADRWGPPVRHKGRAGWAKWADLG
jgi:hypothetical protein